MREEFRAGQLVASAQAGLAAGKNVSVVVEGFKGLARIRSATIETGIVTFVIEETRTVMVTAPAFLAVVIDEPQQ